MNASDADCVIVGAGPAGLHCGTYLGRFRRETIIYHGGKPRAEWIPITYNFPGFPTGITGTELLRLLRRQAERYNVQILRDAVRSIEGSDGRFVVKTARRQTRTCKVVLATGVRDIPPDIPNARHYKGRSIRHCPICDAYEAVGRRIVVFGAGDRAARIALWLSHYTDDIVLLTCGRDAVTTMSESLKTQLRGQHIRVIAQKVTAIEEHGQELGTILLEDGSRVENVFRGYSAMGVQPNSDLAAAAGIELDARGYIKTDRELRTSVEGIYAAGDIVSGEAGQLSIAIGHAATAAISIHNSMLEF